MKLEQPKNLVGTREQLIQRGVLKPDAPTAEEAATQSQEGSKTTQAKKGSK